MKRVITSVFLLLSLVFLIGCEEDSSGNGIEELENTTIFRTGALEHILEGEINQKGQAVGFHYEGLSSKKGEVIPGTATPPDKHGVYMAKVIINDVEKVSNGGRSTFFPKDWTAQEVVDAINATYEHRSFLTGNTYAGLTEDGIEIQMYLDNNDKIISAFPVYEGE